MSTPARIDIKNNDGTNVHAIRKHYDGGALYTGPLVLHAAQYARTQPPAGAHDVARRLMSTNERLRYCTPGEDFGQNYTWAIYPNGRVTLDADTRTDQGRIFDGSPDDLAALINAEREEANGRITLMNLGKNENARYQLLPYVDAHGHDTSDTAQPTFEHDVYVRTSGPNLQLYLTGRPHVAIGKPHGGFSGKWLRVNWTERTIGDQSVSEDTLVQIREEYERIKRTKRRENRHIEPQVACLR